MFVSQINVESLGNSSYLVGSTEAGVCAVVDPVRDVDLYIEEAASRGLRIAYSLETHVHNDFISGSRELAARTGAMVCAPAAGGLIFEHRSLRPGDSIDVGEVRLDVIATPGHTPEHVSYLATDTGDSSVPKALFSGGALLVGGVARSDLLGKDVAPFLGRWFHRTITQELRPLSDDVVVYPTHGGGSFCLARPGASAANASTIGLERESNPFFRAASEADFLDLAASDLPPVPAYYKRMAGINVRGPRILGGLPALYPLSPREVWVRLQRDSIAVDARSSDEYAAAHIPRAYSIPFGGSAGTWVGWLVEEGRPIVLVSDEPGDREEMVRQLIRIGYDALDGYVEGGMDAWAETRLPVSRIGAVSPRDLYAQMEGGDGPVVIDVRFGYEWRSGHIPGTVNVELGDLPQASRSMAVGGRYATVCAAGPRSSTAASILEREGFKDISAMEGGTDSWEEAGLPIERDV